MRRVLALSLCLVLVGLAGAVSHAAARRNVLLLISDNQNWNDLGCYGNNVVQTPNIDRLAKQGVRFSHAFATTASCGPSRAVIYTGLHAHANGQYGHGHGYHTFRLMPKVRTVFQMLVDNGYRTALLGKQHTTPEDQYPFTFNPKIANRDVMGLAKAGSEFINQADDQPFFLVIAYHDPHPTSIERPGWGIVNDYEGVTPMTYDPQDVIVPDYLPDRPEVREGLAGYYQQITRMDAGVGAILKALDQSGKADDTLVIFTSDHGSSEPGAMANQYEPGVRVPFIVRSPEVEQQTLVNNGMLTFTDIVPTILDWTKTKAPDYALHGRSILPILATPQPDGWDEVYLSHVFHEVTMPYPMRTIRTSGYKLIWNIDWRSEYPLPIDTLNRATWQEVIRRGDRLIGPRTVKKYLLRDEIELYDLETDPNEVINLADSPTHAELRLDLSQKLFAYLKKTNDPWLLRHDLPGVGQDDPSPAFGHRRLLNDEGDYVSLFNGKNLDGWQLRRADRQGYAIEDGLLVCPADGGRYLFTDKEYADFSLRFSFRMAEGANNGVAIRCPLVDERPAYEGMEIQILENVSYPQELKPTQYHGSIYDVAPAKRGALKPCGQWNEQEILCQGRRVTVIVNEMVILDVSLDTITDPSVLEKHPGIQRADGHIGLLGHGSRVEFRDIRIREFAE
ncbi:MAG: sulfatase-like hydrolase/transferase [Planctomycetales bacterium]|nr:sulfatase-like hydrolase/transferase [Planctomycetales bacterium]